MSANTGDTDFNWAKHAEEMELQNIALDEQIKRMDGDYDHMVEVKRIEITNLKATLEGKGYEIKGFIRNLEEKDVEITDLTHSLEAKDVEIAGLKRSLEAKDVEIAGLKHSLNEAKEVEITGLKHSLDEAKRDTDEWKARTTDTIKSFGDISNAFALAIQTRDSAPAS